MAEGGEPSHLRERPAPKPVPFMRHWEDASRNFLEPAEQQKLREARQRLCVAMTNARYSQEAWENLRNADQTALTEDEKDAIDKEMARYELSVDDALKEQDVALTHCEIWRGIQYQRMNDHLSPRPPKVQKKS